MLRMQDFHVVRPLTTDKKEAQNAEHIQAIFILYTVFLGLLLKVLYLANVDTKVFLLLHDGSHISFCF